MIAIAYHVYFFKIIASVTTSTKLEHLPTSTVDAILEQINGSLEIDQHDGLLVRYICDASVALFASVKLNRNRCADTVQSFFKL